MKIMLKKSILVGLTLALTAGITTSSVRAEDKGRVLFVLTSHDKLGDSGKKTGWYLEELSSPYYAIKDAGYKIDIASPKGGAAPLDEESKKPEDGANKRFLADKDAMKQVNNTLALSKVKAEDYKAIVFPGGHGPMFDLADNKDSQKLVQKIYEKNGVVAAVCHGPAGLVNVKLKDGSYLLKGKKVTGFTNAEEDAVKKTKYMPFMLESKMAEHGGKFEKSPLWQSHVTIDGNLITGQNPKSAEGMGKEVVKQLASSN